jgi:polysaccharide export outer membrane protein
MTQKIKSIMMALCILTLSMGAFGWAQSASSSDHWGTQTYAKQKINTNKPYQIPKISRAINLDELPQIESHMVGENFFSEPQAATIIEPAAGKSFSQEKIPLEGLKNLIVIPETYSSETEHKEEATIETITEDILAIEVLEEETEIVTDDFAISDTYILGLNDKIKITVYGEKDMSGEFKIINDGSISLPFIGIVDVLNKSPRDIEVIIADKLRDGYLKNPSVSVDLIEMRPFYIMGGVRSPGSYSYVDGINILQAVAIGGGFTKRANRKAISVSRDKDSSSDPVPVSPTDLVKPDDVIYVKERFF